MREFFCQEYFKRVLKNVELSDYTDYEPITLI